MKSQERYKVPGVYFAEEALPSPPRALRTGVPAFLGYVNAKKDSPEGLEPKLVQRWPEFELYFGTPPELGYLAYAVRGFFENGGEMCYVAPLDRKLRPATEALRRGLEDLKELAEIDLVCAPDSVLSEDGTTLDDMKQMHWMILQHCHGMDVQEPGEQSQNNAAVGMGNRFAILDCLPAVDLSKAAAEWSDLTGTNGAIYYPWVQVKSFANDREAKTVPPCGHIAGVYARTDRLYGFHKAPANETVEGIVDLAESGRLTAFEQAQADPNGVVNCLRAFPGYGIKVWGAHTLSGQPEWRYVNVRRVVLTVARYIERAALVVAFQSNNALLWARIRRQLNFVLNDLFLQGVLQGSNPWDAFYVKCDKETNSQIDEGRVITEVGIAPSVPNEFIIIQVVQAAGEVSMVAR